MRPPEVMFGNESEESRGRELVLAYQEILGGEYFDGEHDGGCDLVLDNPHLPVQVKSSWNRKSQDFLAEAIRRRTFIPMLIGDPGQHKREEIIGSIIEHGSWIGDDIPNRTALMHNIEKVREVIMDNGGTIKHAPGQDSRVHQNN